MIWQPGAYSAVNLAINATANLGSVTALADTGLSGEPCWTSSEGQGAAMCGRSEIDLKVCA